MVIKTDLTVLRYLLNFTTKCIGYSSDCDAKNTKGGERQYTEWLQNKKQNDQDDDQQDDHYVINMDSQRPKIGSNWPLTGPYLQCWPRMIFLFVVVFFKCSKTVIDFVVFIHS